MPLLLYDWYFADVSLKNTFFVIFCEIIFFLNVSWKLNQDITEVHSGTNLKIKQKWSSKVSKKTRKEKKFLKKFPDTG